MNTVPRLVAPVGVPLAILAVAAAFTFACADGTLPPRSARDPSNPGAPETPGPDGNARPPPPTATGDDGGSGPPAPAHHHPDHGHSAAAAPASSGGSP
jgi:hypothetical protein